MPMNHAVVDRVLFIRWTATPDDTDPAKMDEAMQQAAGTSPLFHVSVLFPGIEMPSTAVQKGLMRRVVKLRAKCETLHAVYPGTGVKDAIVRRFLKGMVTMLGMKGKAFVHATVDEAVKHLEPRLTMPISSVMAEVQAKHIQPLP